MSRALAALERLSQQPSNAGGWIDTGAVADALGCAAGEVAATLRGASERGLCTCRRSLVNGTTWRLTTAGLHVVVRERRRRRDPLR